MTSDPDDWLTRRRFGDWRVEAFLARGGMASVWSVRHERERTEAVLKVPLSRDVEMLARARREGVIQSALRHPNIVAALDIVDVDGRPGIVLERIEGGLALDSLLLRGPLAASQADILFDGVLSGVEAAHAAGYIHRDLKPGNVLLAQESGFFQPRLADFGLARPVYEPANTKLTRAGYILGSASYMAPEQARDAGMVDTAADIWSLGCMLYELWAGSLVFSGARLEHVLAKVCAARYVPLDALVPTVPDRVVVAVEACLRVNPGERPGSVDELRQIWSGARRWVARG